MGAAKRAREAAEAARSPDAMAERWRKAVGAGLMIGQPVFGGLPCSENADALADLGTVLALSDCPWGRAKTVGESLVPRARNTIARELFRSSFEWLLFIDADIVFTPRDVLILLESGYDVVGGAYPRKQVEFDTVVRAARAGLPKPERFASSYVVNLLPEDVADGAATYDENGCVEVLDLPTGFLLIHRRVFEKIREARGDKSDDVFGRLEYITDDGPHAAPCWNFFPTPVAYEGGRWRYLSEDYGFCRLWQSIGGKCHLHTGIELHHIGRYVFRGDRELIMEGCVR